MKSTTFGLLFSLALVYALMVVAVDAKKSFHKRSLAKRYTDSEGIYYGDDQYYTPKAPRVKHAKTPVAAKPVVAEPVTAAPVVQEAPKDATAAAPAAPAAPVKKARPYDPEQEEHEGEEADEEEPDEVED
ncbi:hypothetical protein V8B55DRAFT_1569508 [Mucor lusitanicus]|uniref:Uncharacterized protein n=2 Tax=Mucor circinelloides f. lusitanicus TaxID=29924 RepID=A0A168KAN0_MUCCL|nr:hypothetical protein FB192DRAFT_1464551 [Mucor lusitanicus]OAD02183.1 hypothetical protein MUCCIDRAFT_164121 [Mucor lusitanicus CBS 277.49]